MGILVTGIAIGGRVVKVKYAAGVVVAAVVLSGCVPSDADGDASTQPESAPPSSISVAPSASTSPDVDPTPSEDTEPADTTGTAADAPHDSALAALALLAVKGRAPMTGYDRDRFGQAWLDADRNGCDTRNDVLAAYLTVVVSEANGCVVSTGKYADPYTGTDIDYVRGDGYLIDIDHVVALGNAWATGAATWDIKKRAALANDPLNLLPADAGANRQKGAGDAATWLPPNKPFRCEYVARQVAVKQKYGLWVTPPEKQAMTRILQGCDDQSLPEDTSAAPTRVDHDITDPGAPASTAPTPDKPAAPATPKSASPKPQPLASVHYANCDAARAAGAAPVRRGDPGYASHLDRDGDGVGCE